MGKRLTTVNGPANGPVSKSYDEDALWEHLYHTAGLWWPALDDPRPRP